MTTSSSVPIIVTVEMSQFVPIAQIFTSLTSGLTRGKGIAFYKRFESTKKIKKKKLPKLCWYLRCALTRCWNVWWTNLGMSASWQTFDKAALMSCTRWRGQATRFHPSHYQHDVTPPHATVGRSRMLDCITWYYRRSPTESPDRPHLDSPVLRGSSANIVYPENTFFVRSALSRSTATNRL